MTEHDREHEKVSPPERREYQPPGIEESSDFETLALACNQDVYGCPDPNNS